MEDHIDVCRRLFHYNGVLRITVHTLRTPRYGFRTSRREVIENANLSSRVEERTSEVRADEPGPSGYQRPHPISCSSLLIGGFLPGPPACCQAPFGWSAPNARLTTERGNIRCPPRERIASSLPESVHRRMVAGLTPSKSAISCVDR